LFKKQSIIIQLIFVFSIQKYTLLIQKLDLSTIKNINYKRKVAKICANLCDLASLRL
jgi:hypothetical protein